MHVVSKGPIFLEALPALENRWRLYYYFFFLLFLVPSPIGCQLRSQKILLNGESTAIDSFMGRKSKRKRDGVTQTVLTFPPILPKEVEDMLAPYFGFHDVSLVSF